MPPTTQPRTLYTRHEPAFRTQYAELVERSRQAGRLLPGTPGSLALRTGTGYGYWYRRYYAVAGRQSEDLVCKEGDEQALATVRARMEFAEWSQQQLRAFRQLGFQVADKDAACVLVEAYNNGLVEAGLAMVGTLAFMSWLNELGARAVTARTQDVDLARRQALKLASPLSFLEAMQATHLQLFPVPGLSPHCPSTSLKRPGKESLRVDMLTHGPELGQVVELPELQWHAQAVPHLDYLLHDLHSASVLAGGHCVPVNLPAPERLLWHKLYASASRQRDPAKAEKDLLQAATLIAILVESDDFHLAGSMTDVPDEVVQAAQSRTPALRRLLKAHPQALDAVEEALADTS